MKVVTQEREKAFAQTSPIRRANTLVFGFMAIVLVAAALPVFFDIYRIVVYRAVSYDDYAPYLLWILGEPGGRLPGSPFAYRPGSVLAAVPFYRLPLIVLHRGPFTDEYLLATQAMCLANVAFVAVSSIVLGAYAHLRLDASLGWSFAGALTFLLFARFLALDGIDGIATLPCLLLIIAALERRILPFFALIVLAAFMNEKVLFVGTIFVTLRAVFMPSHRRTYIIMALIAVALFGLYVLAIKSIGLPGNENQLDPGTYLESTRDMLMRTLDIKGLYQNIWPILLLVYMWFMSIASQNRKAILVWSDIGVAAGLAALAFTLNVKYNVGRIAMYALPLYLLGALQAVAALQTTMRLGGRMRREPRESDSIRRSRP